MTDNYRILIVEDEVLIAEDLHDSLKELGYEPCGICHDGMTAMNEIRRLNPDFVILDINIRGQYDGIRLAELINQHYQIPFIFLSSYSDRDTLNRARHTRPYGYLVKPFKEKDLFTTIETSIFNFRENQKIQNLEKSHIDGHASAPLSEREYALFLDIVAGLNNRQMAEQHHISINTVKSYIKRLFEKLDVNDRVSAVRKVM